jgi:sphingolipid delta-4 desaturase
MTSLFIYPICIRSASQGRPLNEQSQDFTYTEKPNPHTLRSREMLGKYPQIRTLMGPYPLSALYIIFIVAAQLLVGWLMRDQSWLTIVIVAYLFGAFACHALFVLVHEATHDLITKNKTANQLWGILCNIPQLLPSSSPFRVYHIIHHAHMHEYDYDADVPFHGEAAWVGNSRVKKALWFLGFLFIEAVRPMKLKRGSVLSPWILFNVIVVVVADVLIYKYFGHKAFFYLLISNVISVGLHPVGARWIQEHYTYKEGQETYSYYGPLNIPALNVGYHNEHHDFFRIPWINLPKLKKMAPEYYDSLYSHSSWSALIYDFIMNPKRTLHDRILRSKPS